MKPVFIEENFKKLKSIIDSVTGNDQNDQAAAIINDISESLKAYKDNKENNFLLSGSSILLIVLSISTMVMHKSIWPILVILMWVTGWMYYKNKERKLYDDTLIKKSKIVPLDLATEIDYLKSGINLKIGRKQTLKIILSLFFPLAIMIATMLIIGQGGIAIIIGLLSLCVVVSYFFWTYYYKDDIQVLTALSDRLSLLKPKVTSSTLTLAEEEE